MSELKQLPQDIYSLLDPDKHHEPSQDNLDELGNSIKDLIRQRLKEYQTPESPLRFSSLGKKDRQVWYEAHPDGSKEKMTPQTYIKFLYGDLIEQLVVFLAKEAGHTVERAQEEVEVDGVKGHIDCVVDGVVVDIKSASPFGYKKFENRTVTEDDPFGYVDQLSGYSTVLTPGKDAAWIAVDKVSGDICVSPLPNTVMKHHPPDQRIAHLKEVISAADPPPRCYSDTDDGKSGNRKLVTGCSYCPHKYRCWDGLRAFAYSTGPRYLTKVVKLPDVPEIT